LSSSGLQSSRPERKKPAGAKLLLALASSDRDDANFEDGDTFDIRWPAPTSTSRLAGEGFKHPYSLATLFRDGQAAAHLADEFALSQLDLCLP
jgi:cytochrome P450